jgi:hypothetical protein
MCQWIINCGHPLKAERMNLWTTNEKEGKGEEEEREKKKREKEFFLCRVSLVTLCHLELKKEITLRVVPRETLALWSNKINDTNIKSPSCFTKVSLNMHIV